MNGPSLVVMVVVGLLCAAVALGRLRHRSYLLANRPRVIKESLERARAKQIEQGQPAPRRVSRVRRPGDTGTDPRFDAWTAVGRAPRETRERRTRTSAPGAGRGGPVRRIRFRLFDEVIQRSVLLERLIATPTG